MREIKMSVVTDQGYILRNKKSIVAIISITIPIHVNQIMLYTPSTYSAVTSIKLGGEKHTKIL